MAHLLDRENLTRHCGRIKNLPAVAISICVYIYIYVYMYMYILERARTYHVRIASHDFTGLGFRWLDTTFAYRIRFCFCF